MTKVDAGEKRMGAFLTRVRTDHVASPDQHRRGLFALLQDDLCQFGMQFIKNMNFFYGCGMTILQEKGRPAPARRSGRAVVRSA